MKKKGMLITLEGGEGVGKSTALSFIGAFLRDKDIDYVVTREPGGTAVGEAIRSVLLHEDDAKITAETELLLMFAARAQHIAEVVKPALDSGRCVVSDRYTDASFAYQGGGRGVDLSFIQKLSDLVQGKCTPDVTILLDAPVSVGLSRMQNRGKKDRIEKENIEFFERVREAYLKRAKAEPDRFIVINADQDLIAVQKDITTALDKFVKK